MRVQFFALMVCCIGLLTANEFIVKKRKTPKDKRISKSTLKQKLGYAIKTNLEYNALEQEYLAKINQISLQLMQDLIEQQKNSVFEKANYKALKHNLDRLESMNAKKQATVESLKNDYAWLQELCCGCK